MTPQQYLDENDYKPLSAMELKRGKDGIKIFGTNDLMPWTEVYTRISAGMDMGHIAQIYGNGRKIALWAVRDGIELIQDLSDVVDAEIGQRKKMGAIVNSNPEVARTMLDMVNEYAPDVNKNVVMLSAGLINKAQEIQGSVDCTSSDLLNVWKAVQTMTDTLELTQRHGSAMQINAQKIQVTGFEFELDEPPETVEVDAIDVKDEND